MIDAILKTDLTAPRKQRHTVKRIYDRLLDEHEAVDISYQMVRAYVAARREEIRLQAGKGVVEAFVPQTHRPGAEAEVDFGDVTPLGARLSGLLHAVPSQLQEKLASFVVTDAYRRAVQAVQDRGFVLLLGEPGVGKSVIAETLAMTALDAWGCLTVTAPDAAGLVRHWNPHEPNQFFWIDDAFGSVRHERHLTGNWTGTCGKS